MAPASPLTGAVEATAVPLPLSPAPTAAALSTSILLLQPPNLPALQALALDLVNQDRAAAGLRPVQWDATAARLAQAHAEDMLIGQFFSHWNRDGYGPDHRAALLAGSADAVFENIHAFAVRYDDGRPAPIEDWPQRVREAQAGWMQSPGHRATILDPAHTHVGIGIAYRPDIGELRMVQEFLNRYVELAPLPPELPLAAQWPLEGRLVEGASDPLVNLAYEPFPQPLASDVLGKASTYTSAAQPFAAPAVQRDGHSFRASLLFDFEEKPGLYHVRIFVTVDGRQVLAASPMVVVR
ncbi:MAG: CAP domain-containing protein [Caldilineales bacterium]|nr:CAP domain-containing protein [Caldilineales bacterium]